MSYSKAKTFTNTAAANAAVVITVPAITDFPRYIRRIFVGFDSTPAAAVQLKIESDSTKLFEVNLAGQSPISFDFGVPGFPGAAGKSVVITLAADATAVGHLNVIADES